MAEGVAKEAVQKIDTKLECAICFDLYKEPKLLPCFHVFCKSPCLEKLVRYDREGAASLRCPTCRHLVPLSERGVTGLQSDFHIEHLVEIRDFLKRAHQTKEVQCENCEKAPAKGFCRDCQKLVCSKCTENHSLFKELANHKIVSLAEVTAEASKMISPTAKVSHCPRHKDGVLKVFCATCSELICMDCTVRLHKDHNYDLVDDLFAMYKAEITSGLKLIRENIDKVNGALHEFDTIAKAIDDQTAKVEADIHREIDELHRYLDQRRGELIGKLQLLSQQKCKALAAQRDGVEVILAKHTSCLEYAEGGLETGTPAEVVVMKGRVLQRIQDITTEFDPATIHPGVSADTVLVTDGKEEIVKSCKQFADVDKDQVSAENSLLSGDGLKGVTVGKAVVVDLYTMTRNNKRCVDNVPVSAELVHVKSHTKTVVKINKKEANKYTISFTPTHKGRHELHVSICGEVVRDSPFSLSIDSSPASLGQPNRVIRGLVGPYGVTTNSKGHTIVTEIEVHQVTTFDKDGTKIRSFGTRGAASEQFNGPRGVAVDSRDNIYIVDGNNYRIQKFSPDGNFLSSAGTEGSGNLQFNFPSGVGYNKSNDMVYVSDQSNHRVQVLTSDLTFHSTFGSKGSGDGELLNPLGVCFDEAGNVYVADSSNNRVQVFTVEGDFVRKFGSRGDGPGQLKSPRGIAISSGVVYVSERDGSRISMFTITGEFIRSFGTCGSNDGQFSRPASVTVDDEENIIVADMKNNRIQIL